MKIWFIKFIQRVDIDQIFCQHLGPEPLSIKFNTGYFKNYVIRKKRNIKTF